MKKLKGVIVGAGYFSQFHGDAWSRMPNVKILAVCDKDVKKAKLYANQFGIPNVHDDIHEMFEVHQPDFVDIVTPPSTHKAIIKAAIAQKVNIICQKPLADTYQEALEIRKLLADSGIRFMVHENWRFQPWYREIKSVIQSGTIGKKIFNYSFKMRLGDGWSEDAYLDRQPYFRNMPRLLIHETGVHFVDTFRFLEGEISEVYAHLKTLNPFIKGEDSAMVFFQFESGCTALFDANRYHEPPHNNVRYTFGEMWVEGDKGTLTLHSDGQITIKQLGAPNYKLPFRPSEIGFAGDCVFVCQDHFVQGILKQSPFETEIDDYIKTLNVVEAIYHSHNEKAVCPIKQVK